MDFGFETYLPVHVKDIQRCYNNVKSNKIKSNQIKSEVIQANQMQSYNLNVYSHL